MNNSIEALKSALARRDAQNARNTELLGQAVSQLSVSPELAAVYEHGTKIFGSIDAWLHWLCTPHALFEKNSPIEVIHRGELKAIEEALNRIDHGIP